FVRQFAAIEPGWFDRLPLPAVKAWLSGWSTDPLFNVAMVKLTPRQVLPFAALCDGPTEQPPFC
ncbi:hypothetical protein RZS08_46730, partial [Arthrospira platensis SPKY1]|nr:hypothetical protein [Arthrospira platensis SPKY1]